MSPTQVAAVQRTFSLVVPIKEQAAAMFYERLFSIDPTTKPLFKGDMKDQGRKLMAALATVVTGLNNSSSILPAVQALGRRHVGYGVKDEHYASVGAALLWTLEKGLGDEFTPDVKGAWADAYGLLAGVMKDAAAQADRA
jgi:hemoglobin-like flavoprotein